MAVLPIDELKKKIDSNIYQNSQQAITGTRMNTILNDMVDSLDETETLNALSKGLESVGQGVQTNAKNITANADAIATNKEEADAKLTELESETNEINYKKANIKAGKNKLNPLSCKSNTYIDAENGEEKAFDNCFATWYIPVDGQNLYCNNPSLIGSVIGWAAYAENKNFTHGDSINRYRYTYQEGDVYVRFSISTLENTQIEIGKTATEYEPFNPVGGWGISELEDKKLNKEEFTDIFNDWKTIPTRLLDMVNIEGNLTSTLLEIKDGYYIAGIDENGKLQYLGNSSYKTYLFPVDGKSTYLFDFVRFAVLMETREKAKEGATLLDSVYTIDSTGANYIAISINVETYPLDSFRIGIGELYDNPQYRIPYLILEKNSVDLEMLSFTSIGKNKFNINDKNCVLGHYLAANILYILDTYNVTGYIGVKPSTTYQCSCDGDKVSGEYLARFVCQYDKDGKYIENADLQPSTSTNQFTTGVSTYYVRISVNALYWDKYQVEEGYSVTAWEKYSHIIKKDVLPTIQKKIFTRLHGTSDLTNGQTLTLLQNFVRKNIAFSVKIHNASSTGLDVLMGLGYKAYTGGWLELTDTKLKVHHYIQSDVVASEYDHNLTLGKDIVILFDGEIENATIKIISDGQIFSQEIARDSYFAGAGFVSNVGSNAINAEMNVMPKDINQKIWLYGDSYLGYLNSERWLTYMLEWGFNSWMSDSRPGGNSAEGYVSMTTDMKIGKPKYILWLNGMNDGGDTDANTPSTIWMSNIEKVINLTKDIELILATIPSVPTINHEAKNAWVRNSGYRYIDFASAVGADANGTWKDGMLSGDGVHPTTLGARALASQVLIDFPEIMVKS